MGVGVGVGVGLGVGVALGVVSDAAPALVALGVVASLAGSPAPHAARRPSSARLAVAAAAPRAVRRVRGSGDVRCIGPSLGEGPEQIGRSGHRQSSSRGSGPGPAVVD
ncbi:hypothetical protein Slu03_15950 [Sediminihabitans luteus]|nr:hypothetical protein Slu03_15950 [Sediminihabitans luteus]